MSMFSSRLQAMPSLPMAEGVLSLLEDGAATCSALGQDDLATNIMHRQKSDLQALLEMPRETRVDQSQTASFVAGLTERISLIQGPPSETHCQLSSNLTHVNLCIGTGKSFIGALLSKAFLAHTIETILVLCYTNHALDQFLEDILDMSVAEEDMLRLGSKSTVRTKALGLPEQDGGGARPTPNLSQNTPRTPWRLRQCFFEHAEASLKDIQKCANSFSRWHNAICGGFWGGGGGGGCSRIPLGQASFRVPVRRWHSLCHK